MNSLYSLSPSFEIRRLEIQKSIMNLEERLLKRKQADLITRKQISQRESPLKYDIQQRMRINQSPSYGIQKKLNQRLGYLQKLDPYNGIGKVLEQQKVQADYLTRLKQLELQKRIIDQQYIQKKEQILYYHKPVFNKEIISPLEASGETLARKYFDGTRALELNEELKKSNDNLRRIADKKAVFNKKQLIDEDRNRALSYKKQPNYSTVKKYTFASENKQKDRESQNQNNYYVVESTPINFIYSSPQKTKFADKDSQNKNIVKNLMKIQEKDPSQQSPTLKSKGLKKSRSKTSEPFYQNAPKQQLWSKKVPSEVNTKQTSKATQFLSTRQKSAKSLKNFSTTKQFISQKKEQPIQKTFHKTIQDRLGIFRKLNETNENLIKNKELSKAYERLFEKQQKARKQLIQKVCKIPHVLKYCQA